MPALVDAEAAPRTGIARISTLAAFAHREFRLIWIGAFTSGVGTWMQVFAQSWLAVEMAIAEGTPGLIPLYLGIINVARGVPVVVLSAYGGVLADRFDRRVLLGWVQAAHFVAGLALALVTISGHITLPWLVALGAIEAGVTGIEGPVQQSMLSRVVPRRDLLSGIGLTTMTQHGSAIVGPLVSGLLIGTIGAGGLFVLKAFSHLPLIAICFMLSPMPVQGGGVTGNPVRAMLEALRYIWNDPILRGCLIFAFTAAMLIRSLYGVMPAVAVDLLHGGAQELSWLLAATGLGAVLGAMAMAPLGAMKRRGLLLCVATALSGVVIVAFSQQREILPALFFAALIGTVPIIAGGVNVNFLQTRPPDALRGRVLSLLPITFGGMGPLGVMLIAAVATVTSLDIALALTGITVVVIVAGAIFPIMKDVRG